MNNNYTIIKLLELKCQIPCETLKPHVQNECRIGQMSSIRYLNPAGLMINVQHHPLLSINHSTNQTLSITALRQKGKRRVKENHFTI